MNTKTATMSVSLPKEMKEHIKRRVKEEHYGTPSDYVRSLVREDIKQQEKDRIRALLLEGMSSKSRKIGEKEWKVLEQKLLKSVKE